MEQKTQNRTILTWKNNYGLFEATLWDGKLSDFRACESGSQPTFCNSNVGFLHTLNNALSDLLHHLDSIDEEVLSKDDANKPINVNVSNPADDLPF